jgi:hypothetical protein
MLCLLRDLFTAATVETFSRDTVLVLLRTMAENEEVFPHGEGVAVWEAD